MRDYLSQVPAFHLQLFFLGKKFQPASQSPRWHCRFGGKGTKALTLVKSLAKSSDICGTQTLFHGVKSHPLDLPAQAAEVVV